MDEPIVAIRRSKNRRLTNNAVPMHNPDFDFDLFVENFEASLLFSLSDVEILQVHEAFVAERECS